MMAEMRLNWINYMNLLLIINVVRFLTILSMNMKAVIHKIIPMRESQVICHLTNGKMFHNMIISRGCPGKTTMRIFLIY